MVLHCLLFYNVHLYISNLEGVQLYTDARTLRYDLIIFVKIKTKGY